MTKIKTQLQKQLEKEKFLLNFYFVKIAQEKKKYNEIKNPTGRIHELYIKADIITGHIIALNEAIEEVEVKESCGYPVW